MSCPKASVQKYIQKYILFYNCLNSGGVSLHAIRFKHFRFMNHKFDFLKTLN